MNYLRTYIFILILLGGVSGCENQNEMTDATAPIINDVSVMDLTMGDQPRLTFSTTEGGTITWKGSCSTNTNNVNSGVNSIVLSPMLDGNYSDCSFTVTNSSGKESLPQIISSFVVDARFIKLNRYGHRLVDQQKPWNEAGSESTSEKWVCVRQNIQNGLLWEVKTNDGGLRDKDNVYNSNGVKEVVGVCGGIDCDSQSYIDAMNEIALCGSTNWRLPVFADTDTIPYRTPYLYDTSVLVSRLLDFPTSHFPYFSTHFSLWLDTTNGGWLSFFTDSRQGYTNKWSLAGIMLVSTQ